MNQKRIHYSGQDDGIDSAACIVTFTLLVLGSYLKSLHEKSKAYFQYIINLMELLFIVKFLVQ